jgi:hypothetical protein
VTDSISGLPVGFALFAGISRSRMRVDSLQQDPQRRLHFAN